MPELDFYQERLYDAFAELNTCRYFSSNTEGPIPWTALRDYAITEGFSEPDDFEAFRLIIRGLDKEYMGQMKAKRAARMEAEKAKRGKRTGR